jgi:hypothetical protein
MTVLALFAVGSANEPQTGNRADGFWKRMATTSTGLGVLAFAAFAAIVWASADGQNANTKALLALATASLVGMWSAVAALSIWGYRGGEEIRHRILCRHFVLLAIADAALTMGLSESTVCGPRSQWNATAAEHVASPDLTERGLDREFSTQAAGLSRNANLASKVPSLSGYLGIVNTFHTETLDHPSLSSIALGPQRIWFSPEAARVPLTEGVFHRFAEIADQRGRPSMVISDRPSCAPPSQDSHAAGLSAEFEDRLTALPAVEPASIHLTEYSPNRLTFDAAVPSDGWLLVTDRWAAGWESRVNGIATGVQIGNFIFRAVPVREGSNHVDFQYRPFGFPWLLGLSWLTLASVLFATLVPRLFPRSHSAV